MEAPFLYAENGDDISLGYATGKIVMVNGPVRKDLYEKLVKAGAVAYLSISGAPIDEGEDLKPALYSLPSMKETPIQGVCIHHRDAVDLVSRGASRAKLVLKQKLVERISANVAARITGTEKPDEDVYKRQLPGCPAFWLRQTSLPPRPVLPGSHRRPEG